MVRFVNRLKARGFALIEILVAVGILGIIVLAMSSLMLSANQQLAHMDSKMGLIVLANDIRIYMSNPTNCLSAFPPNKKVKIAASAETDTNLFLWEVDGAQLVLRPAQYPNTFVDNYAVRIRRVHLENVNNTGIMDGANTVYTANLVISAETRNNVALKPAQAGKVFLSLDGNRVIQNCSATSSDLVLATVCGYVGGTMVDGVCKTEPDMDKVCAGIVGGTMTAAGCEIAGGSVPPTQPDDNNGSCTAYYEDGAVTYPHGALRTSNNMNGQSCCCTTTAAYTCSNGSWLLVQGCQTSNCTCSGGGQGSCFTGETMILMADGSLRRIDEIKVGDYVRSGVADELNRVVDIEVPPLNDRYLMGFNGGVPFFTWQHPFLTREGWKSYNPVSTFHESPNLELAGMLEVGDEVLLNGEWMRIESFEFSTSEMPYLPVYNLILEGDHSYIANGFTVHNKAGGM